MPAVLAKKGARRDLLASPVIAERVTTYHVRLDAGLDVRAPVRIVLLAGVVPLGETPVAAGSFEQPDGMHTSEWRRRIDSEAAPACAVHVEEFSLCHP